MFLNKLKQKLDTLRYFLKPKKVIVVCRAFYGDEWMALAVKSVEKYVHKVLIVTSKYDWGQQNERVDDIEGIFERLKEILENLILFYSILNIT